MINRTLNKEMETQCVAVKKNGETCTNKRKDGKYCGVHKIRDTQSEVRDKQSGNEKSENIRACITITFCDVCENHVGMQNTGILSHRGLLVKELVAIGDNYRKKGYEIELIRLDKVIKPNVPEGIVIEKAAVLVVRGFLGKNGLPSNKNMMKEEMSLDWDKKAFMKGRVVNKIARHNLCYSEKDQEPDYENKKGRIISFDNLPLLKKVRNEISTMNKLTVNLNAEGNLYYDTNKCSIKFHGDYERKIVIALRLGASEDLPLKYAWFHRTEPVSEVYSINLNAGDLYIMSAKAVGQDWKNSSQATLRHAVNAKFTVKKAKK